MKNPKTDEEVYYVRAITEQATIIGKRNFQPTTAPVAVPKSEYNAERRKYEHYENKGTLSIERPQDRNYARAAREARAAQRIMEEEDTFGQLPPPSLELPTLGIPAAVREEAARQRMRTAKADPDYCRAKRTDGLQCRSRPRKGYLYCAFHSKMVVDGREVKDMDGGLVKLEDVE